MDITMIGLQNAGKTSLLRVLAVSVFQIGKWPRYVHDIFVSMPD
jgi:GTPase involved in cell partitioning and DNA repair